MTSRLLAATDLVNPRLVDNIPGVGGVAQSAEGLIITAGWGGDRCNTNAHKKLKN